MKILVPTVALVAVAWAAAPWVSMVVRGTSDQCALRAMRGEVAIPSPRLPADGTIPSGAVARVRTGRPDQTR